MTTTRDLVTHRLAAALESSLGATTEIEVVRPSLAEHGDFSTNAALKLAGTLRRPPREVASALVEAIGAGDGDELISRAEVAGPGFVNLWLAARHVEASVDAIRALGTDYGRSTTAQARRINVEFVSANPTGPLTVANARGAFVGDLLCRVLEAAGHDVTREYYFNDAGTQVEKLGESVRAVRFGQPVPDDGYHGTYVEDLAGDVPIEVWQQAGADETRAGWIIGDWTQRRIREGIEASLQRLGVRFDVWTSEQAIVDDGWVEQAVDRLRAAGHAYESEGALWFASTAFGDDKDRVIFRTNGEPTYFAKDIG